MKPQQRIKEMRRAGTATARLKIAGDYYPGTDFDAMMDYMAWHLSAIRELRAAGKAEPLPRPSEAYTGEKFDFAGYHSDALQAFGESVVEAILKRESNLFKDLGDALEQCKSHRPQPDRIQLALLNYWLKRERLPQRGAVRVTPQKPAVTMRELVAHLVEMGLAEKAVRSCEHEGLRKKIRRICDELGIAVRGKAGRPK